MVIKKQLPRVKEVNNTTITECDIHTEIRQRFVGNIKSHIDGYEDLPANGKFVTVMRSSSEVVIKQLAKFVYKAFQQRLHDV